VTEPLDELVALRRRLHAQAEVGLRRPVRRMLGLTCGLRVARRTYVGDQAVVLHGELDFGVITMPMSPTPKGLQRVPLVWAAVGVCARTDHPLATRDHLHWRDVEPQPIVTMRTGTVMWEVLHRHVADPDVVVQAMSARTVKVMVGQGAGLRILARFDTSADIPGLTWLPLLDAPPVTLCLSQRSDSQPSRPALIVRQFIRAKAEELSLSGPG
jgi:DNA-binding transcriptional LysR family regulator